MRLASGAGTSILMLRQICDPCKTQHDHHMQDKTSPVPRLNRAVFLLLLSSLLGKFYCTLNIDKGAQILISYTTPNQQPNITIS